MDRATPGLDFAVIGHQDSWQNITDFINGIRTADDGKLNTDKIKDIYSFIPARSLFKMKIRSKTGAQINGIYIESFIEPDKLEIPFLRMNIGKVRNAITYARKMGAKITTLGGFTSIVLEGNIDSFSEGESKFTTGNTLTAAFIVKGVEKAALQQNLNLKDSSVLIVGATGDIGMACIRYFQTRIKKFLLCARNNQQLDKLSKELKNENIQVDSSVSVQDLVDKADIIICVASSSGIKLSNLRKNVIVCDAGYPKNLESKIENLEAVHLYHGGMGLISEGYSLDPDHSDNFYRYAAPYIAHGCVLEAIVLAFENRYESFSTGKGLITVDKIEEIYTLSLKHGIILAPFYNIGGLWKFDKMQLLNVP
jgi:fatty aldehyde-generating acyl-ACP reductase